MITLWIFSKLHTLFWAYKDRATQCLFLLDPAVVDLKAVNSFKTTAINGDSVLTSVFGHLLGARNADDGCGAACVFGFRKKTRNSKMYKKHTLIDSRWKWRRFQIWKEKWKWRVEFRLICIDKTQPRTLAKKKHTNIKLITACLDKYNIPNFSCKKKTKKHTNGSKPSTLSVKNFHWSTWLALAAYKSATGKISLLKL